MRLPGPGEYARTICDLPTAAVARDRVLSHVALAASGVWIGVDHWPRHLHARLHGRAGKAWSRLRGHDTCDSRPADTFADRDRAGGDCGQPRLVRPALDDAVDLYQVVK